MHIIWQREATTKGQRSKKRPLWEMCEDPFPEQMDPNKVNMKCKHKKINYMCSRLYEDGEISSDRVHFKPQKVHPIT